MARYKVPQNIDMEDKIVGPLTMAQFVYLLFGGMIIYLVWLAFPNTFLFYVIALPVTIVAGSFAFLKVQDQPLPKFLGATILYMTRPKNRVWQKDESIEHLKIVTKQATRPGEKSIGSGSLAAGELDQLASVLDTGDRQKLQEEDTVPTPATPATPATKNDAATEDSTIDQLDAVRAIAQGVDPEQNG